MNITELQPDTEVTVTARFKGKELNFKSVVREVTEHYILVEELKDEEDNAVSFKTAGVYLEMVAVGDKKQPILWKNVVIKHVRWNKQEWHQIFQSEEGKTTNRRNAYRLPIGRRATIQAGENTKARDVTLKDISNYGFAFILLDEIEIGTKVHIFCQVDDFVIDMFGKVVRKEKMRGRPDYIYGCHTSVLNSAIDRYIISKQREQLKNKAH